MLICIGGGIRDSLINIYDDINRSKVLAIHGGWQGR